MKKREFLKTAGILAVGSLILPLAACGDTTEQESNGEETTDNQALSFSLPDLPYAANALEPVIDQKTMEIHHGKHHAGYVKKLNAALEGDALATKATNLVDLLGRVEDKEAHLGIRRNGGGHFNHSLFWNIMKPNGGGAPSGKLAEAINAAFGDFASFKESFIQAALGRFGSGWAWLCVGVDKKLFITDTPNQDNPLMKNIVEKTGMPIFGIDVWEHAYYLNYQNERKRYVESFFQVVNWEEVDKRMLEAMG